MHNRKVIYKVELNKSNTIIKLNITEQDCHLWTSYVKTTVTFTKHVLQDLCWERKHFSVAPTLQSYQVSNL